LLKIEVACHGFAFMVAAYEIYVSGEAAFKLKEQGEHFYAVISSVDIVAKEEVGGGGRVAKTVKEF
jgi:hypothetical protein